MTRTRTRTEVVITDLRQDYHRNGIGGEGHVLSFFRATDGDTLDNTPMMAVAWGGEPVTECAVFRLQDIAAVAVGYLDGITPDTIGWTSEEELATGKRAATVGAWRSTDYFLPAIRAAEPLRPCWTCGIPCGPDGMIDGEYHSHGGLICRPQCCACTCGQRGK